MNRGEIWLVNLDPTIGEEIRKTRPAVIVNDDAIGILPLRVIVPITTWKNKYDSSPWMVRLEPDTNNGLKKRSTADAFQVRSVSRKRITQHMGRLSTTDMQKITKALATVLRIIT